MMTVMGFIRADFKGQDGNLVRGYNVFLSYELGEDGEGAGCERIYMTDDKLTRCGYQLKVGDTVDLLYNRYRKVAAIIPVAC